MIKFYKESMNKLYKKSYSVIFFIISYKKFINNIMNINNYKITYI